MIIIAILINILVISQNTIPTLAKPIISTLTINFLKLYKHTLTIKRLIIQI